MDLDRFRYYTAWHQFVNERTYDAPADPWTLVRVDPTEVEHYTSEIRLNWGLGRVQGGGWDREENLGRLHETDTYRGLVQRFEEGRDWEETVLYRRAEEAFGDGESFRGYDSLAAYRDVRCEHVDDLFRSIRDEGYRPNREATHEKPADGSDFEDAYANHLEPLVAIGRSGEIIWCEGYHRLILSSILDLDAIPVYVLVRHERWQRVRDRVCDSPDSATSERPPELDVDLDHPDLQDLRS